MDTDFDYLSYVNALDIRIQYEGDDISVDRVYGSPGNEQPTTGVLCHITSSFPSPKEHPTTTKGGVVLIKFKRNPQKTQIVFKCSYKDCEGNSYADDIVVNLPSLSEEYFEGSAVRKAVLLTRYVNIMKQFIRESSVNRDSSKQSLKQFKLHFQQEADLLQDAALHEKLKLLDQFLKINETTNTHSNQMI